MPSEVYLVTFLSPAHTRFVSSRASPLASGTVSLGAFPSRRLCRPKLPSSLSKKELEKTVVPPSYWEGGAWDAWDETRSSEVFACSTLGGVSNGNDVAARGPLWDCPPPKMFFLALLPTTVPYVVIN